MKITDALLGEHAVIYTLFAHVEERLATCETLDDVKELSRIVSAVLLPHAHIEDEILFPALEAHIGPMGPLACMRSEHQTIDDTLQSIADVADPELAKTSLSAALTLARQHFGKEEQALFRICKNALSEDELEDLGKKWAAARRVYVA